MYAVTVKADWFVGWRIWRLFLEQRHSRAMKVCDVSVKHLRGNAVLIHDLWIGVARGANIRRLQAEGRRRRITDVVYAVAVNAGRHIGIVVRQCRAMHAVVILRVDGAVTFGARLRNPQAGVLRQLSRRWISQALHRMRTMAVGTDGSIDVARLQRPRVDAVIRFGSLIRVALLTD